jgi:hypothetical protein
MDSSGRVVSQSQRPLSTQKHKHICGIRTRDPSNQSALDLGLRPCGHRDRLTEFVVPMKLGGLIKISLNGNYSNVRLCKYVFNGLRERGGSLLFLFSVALQIAIMTIQH